VYICIYYLYIVMCICILVEVVERGRELLQLVACSSLEREFTDFTEAWVVAASSEVDNELKR